MSHLQITIFREIVYREMQVGVDMKRNNGCFVRVNKKEIPVVFWFSHGVHFQTVKTRQTVDV